MEFHEKFSRNYKKSQINKTSVFEKNSANGKVFFKKVNKLFTRKFSEFTRNPKSSKVFEKFVKLKGDRM